MRKKYDYIIVGGGLAGASAVEGIRSMDRAGSVLLTGIDPDPPYDRPPLSKQLWTGKKKPEDIFLHDAAYYRDQGVDLEPGKTVAALGATGKAIMFANGDRVGYGKLLLATGGRPRALTVPGGDLPEICYYRTLADYRWVRARVHEGATAVVVGGGFIGSEIAAALTLNKVTVTMIFPEKFLARRVFPEGLGSAVQSAYLARGVTILSEDVPVSFEKRGGTIVTRTKTGRSLEADFVVAGIGISPETGLAAGAGIPVGDGITVDEFLATAQPDVYAAGDNAEFSSLALGRRMRVEHWDNAVIQGKAAGRNMAGAAERFDYIPYFFSDLFDFGYEAAGLCDSRLETRTVWKKENETGIVYYLLDGTVKGVLLCNVWGKVDEARRLLRSGERLGNADLEKAIAV